MNAPVVPKSPPLQAHPVLLDGRVKANRIDSLERESQGVAPPGSEGPVGVCCHGVGVADFRALIPVSLPLRELAHDWEFEHLTLQSLYHEHNPNREGREANHHGE